MTSLMSPSPIRGPVAKSPISVFSLVPLLLWVPFSVADAQTNFDVLMIGNSYTQGNSSAPATYSYLQGFFDSAAQFSATVVNQSVSAYSLRDHAIASSTTVAHLVNSAGQYDAIVLQDRSDLPGRAMKFGGSQLSQLNQGGPVLIEDYIKVYHPQAAAILFNTWARHPNDEPPGNDDLASYFNDDPLEMQAFTNQGYQHIVTGSPKGNLSDVAVISPVGDAWQAWYATYGYTNGSIDLHQSDGTHQNSRGAYLAAAALFQSITGTSVIGNGYTAGITGTIGGERIVDLLQYQAATTAGFPELAGDYNDDGLVDAADYGVSRDHLGLLIALPNEDPTSTRGQVTQEDYDVWKNHFGQTLESHPVTTAVPEPSGLLLIIAWARILWNRRS